jgi:hypothetical protein
MKHRKNQEFLFIKKFYCGAGGDPNNRQKSGNHTNEVIQLMDISKFNEETRAYFETLPIFVKEGVMRSGLEVNSREELEKCAKSVLERP